jgi:formate dehydrogenase major subunit
LIEARVMITDRLKPMNLDGRVLHQVALPYHWGYKGLVKGDSVNDLIALSEEPNVRIMETKALLCNLIPGRRARGKEAVQEWRDFMKHPVPAEASFGKRSAAGKDK